MGEAGRSHPHTSLALSTTFNSPHKTKIGIIKDRNGMNLTEAEDIKKILRRGGKNTQKNYTKKILMTQITTMV